MGGAEPTDKEIIAKLKAQLAERENPCNMLAQKAFFHGYEVSRMNPDDSLITPHWLFYVALKESER